MNHNFPLEELYEEKKEPSKEEEKEEADDFDLSTVLSSTEPFRETEHARLRRTQRCIDKIDLKAAIKYGKHSQHFWKGGTVPAIGIDRITHNGITYIVRRNNKTGITSYAAPMSLTPVRLLNEMHMRYYDKAIKKIQDDLDCWTSNTVIVIDTSGSMRTSDVWGTNNRLKAVFFSVALDYIAQRLENGNATFTDVISVIAMGDDSTCIIEELPTTWFAYNMFVELYTKRILIPEGHGNFLPSLTAAEELLYRNANASCAAALIFLSDGAPSDRGMEARESIIQKVESLAKAFGRRLTFTAIGIGALDDFGILQKMVDAAKDYGANAEFMLPSMTSSSLGQSFTSVATSLTMAQTEMTNIGSLKQRKVREVVRESKSKASEALCEVSDDDFRLYDISKVTRKVYKDDIDDNGMRKVRYDTVPLQYPDSAFVALAKGPFGEGAERFAFRFFEVAVDRKTILGSPMVAKESRMVLEKENGMTESDAREKFVRKFIMTQQMARRLAVKFNDRLQTNRRVHGDTPKISFLDCSIYELDDKNGGKSSVLVENKLDHNKWKKWNSNNGMVDGVMRPNKDVVESKHVMLHKNIGMNEVAHNVVALDLNKIEEDSEEEDDDEEEDEEEERECGVGDNGQAIAKILFTPSQVAQAFSHFSYLRYRKRLVCDLQGVYDEKKNLLQFSDPVIHYYNPSRSHRRGVHGLTDRGRNGIKDFFATHCCKEHGHLCNIVTRGFRSIRQDHHNTHTRMETRSLTSTKKGKKRGRPY